MRGYKLVFIIFGIVVAALRECQPKTQNVHKQIGLVYGGEGATKKYKGKIQLVVQRRRRAMATHLNCCYSPEILYMYLPHYFIFFRGF